MLKVIYAFKIFFYYFYNSFKNKLCIFSYARYFINYFSAITIKNGIRFSKSICKLLDRDLRISHSFGGSNTLECNIRFDESADEIITKVEQNQFQYAVILKEDMLNRPLILLFVLFYIFLQTKNIFLLLIKMLTQISLKKLTMALLNIF